MPLPDQYEQDFVLHGSTPPVMVSSVIMYLDLTDTSHDQLVRDPHAVTEGWPIYRRYHMPGYCIVDSMRTNPREHGRLVSLLARLRTAARKHKRRLQVSRYRYQYLMRDSYSLQAYHKKSRTGSSYISLLSAIVPPSILLYSPSLRSQRGSDDHVAQVLLALFRRP